MADGGDLIIDVRDFPTGGLRKLNLSGNVSVPKSYCENEKSHVDVFLNLERLGEDLFRFEGAFTAELKLKCDLCLDEFLYKLEAPINGAFERGEGSPDDCRWGFCGEALNLKDPLYAEILLNLPMKRVCRDDCKGLCPKCGANLNRGDCGCDTFIGNEAFLSLKQMFNED